MKYEEAIYIDNEGEEKEIIHLYDLNQSLVVDYAEDPQHIQLIDMKTKKVIRKSR